MQRLLSRSKCRYSELLEPCYLLRNIGQMRQMKLTILFDTNSNSSSSNNNPSVGSVTDLGNGSEVVYTPQFLPLTKSWEYFNYLDKNMPWIRPTVHVFGKAHVQPRDVCYVATKGLKDLVYSGYKPNAYSWDDYPPLKEILDEVHKANPGSHFNSILLNRYTVGSDYVGWHSDNEPLYGPTPEIASVSFGCERDFILKKKTQGEVGSKRGRKTNEEKHCFKLKHGSLLVMRGYTQRDWLHSVPKRAKAESSRINLTFRRVVEMAQPEPVV